MNWAWDQRLPPNAKLILMALADSADDAGECWPRLRTLASKCCVSERTVQRALQQFEGTGLLSVEHRFTDGGRQTSNRYRLAVGAYPDKLSPSPSSSIKEGDNDVTPRVTELRPPGGDTAMSGQEPPEDSSREPTARKAVGLHFPDSLPSAQKTEVARLLRHLEPSQAQILLDELDGALQVPGTIRTSAARWLRALIRRHAEGTFVPRAGVGIAQKRRRQGDVRKPKAMADGSGPSPETLERLAKAVDAIRKKAAGVGRR